MGIRSFFLVVPDEEKASMATMNHHKESIFVYTASNQAMTGVELTGVVALDKTMERTVTPTSDAEPDDAEEEPPAPKTVHLSVREILMAIDMPDTDKPLFHMIAETPGGGHEGFYPENNDRE